MVHTSSSPNRDSGTGLWELIKTTAMADNERETAMETKARMVELAVRGSCEGAKCFESVKRTSDLHKMGPRK